MMVARAYLASLILVLVALGCGESTERPPDDGSIRLDGSPEDSGAAMDARIDDATVGVDAPGDGASPDSRPLDAAGICDANVDVPDAIPPFMGSPCADEASADVLLRSNHGPDRDQSAAEFAADCGGGCLCDPDMGACTSTCVEELLNPDCAECMTRVFTCAAIYCRGECYGAGTDADCGRCLEATTCWERGMACAGYLGPLPGE